MSELALLGGRAVLNSDLKLYPAMGDAERTAVMQVMQGGTISGFYGSWGPEFLGGPVVREFEQAWAARFGSRFCVSVNSATSGLYAAMGAIGIEPGDEVIVPPYTMSATAMAPLIYGGIPVFADIEPETFCLDPDAVEAALTERTRAIVVVNLFGHPAALHRLRALADARGLYLIEDNAQGPLASEQGKMAGTIGHIGIFSLNYHKHIHTGEGGMCVTDDEQLALKLQMIRNHGENVVETVGLDPSGLIGFNYRLTELQAAIGLAQLNAAAEHVGRRQAIAESLSAAIAGNEYLIAPSVREDCRHVYYLWAARWRHPRISRARLSEALAAEGFPHFLGYVRPIYQLPVFKQRRAFGDYPFSLSQRDYPAGLCPVTEHMHYQELLCFETCMYDIGPEQTEALAQALQKVLAHLPELEQA